MPQAKKLKWIASKDRISALVRKAEKAKLNLALAMQYCTAQHNSDVEDYQEQMGLQLCEVSGQSSEQLHKLSEIEK